MEQGADYCSALCWDCGSKAAQPPQPRDQIQARDRSSLDWDCSMRSICDPSCCNNRARMHSLYLCSLEKKGDIIHGSLEAASMAAWRCTAPPAGRLTRGGARAWRGRRRAGHRCGRAVPRRGRSRAGRKGETERRQSQHEPAVSVVFGERSDAAF
jgi:hypothetical protein